MNALYSTLGDGNKTAVLRHDTSWGTTHQTKVLTCPHRNATHLARALAALHAEMPNALWGVAAHYDGKPARARRRLIAVLDGKTRSDHTNPDSPWSHADALIEAVRIALNLDNGTSTAVRAATRREVLDHGMNGIDDGILIGAVLWAACRKPGYLRLVLNPALTDATLTGGPRPPQHINPFWDDLDLDSIRRTAIDAHPCIDIDCTPLGHLNEAALVTLLHDYAPCAGRPYGEDEAALIFEETNNNDFPYLTVALGHLEAAHAARQVALG